MDDKIFIELENALEEDINQERFELLGNGVHKLDQKDIKLLSVITTEEQVDAIFLRAKRSFWNEEVSHRKYSEYTTLLHAIEKDLRSSNPGSNAFVRALTEVKESDFLTPYKKLALKGGVGFTEEEQIKELSVKPNRFQSEDKITILNEEKIANRAEVVRYVGAQPHYNALLDLERRTYFKELLKDLNKLHPDLAHALVDQKLAAQAFRATRANTEYLFDELLYSNRRENRVAHMYASEEGKEKEYWEKILVGRLNTRREKTTDNEESKKRKWGDGLVFTVEYAENMHRKSSERLTNFYSQMGLPEIQVKKALLMWTSLFSLYDQKSGVSAIPLTKEERHGILYNLAENIDIDEAFISYLNLYKSNPKLFPKRAERVLRNLGNIKTESIIFENPGGQTEAEQEDEERVQSNERKTDLIELMGIRKKGKRGEGKDEGKGEDKNEDEDGNGEREDEFSMVKSELNLEKEKAIEVKQKVGNKRNPKTGGEDLLLEEKVEQENIAQPEVFKNLIKDWSHESKATIVSGFGQEGIYKENENELSAEIMPHGMARLLQEERLWENIPSGNPYRISYLARGVGTITTVENKNLRPIFRAVGESRMKQDYDNAFAIMHEFSLKGKKLDDANFPLFANYYGIQYLSSSKALDDSDYFIFDVIDCVETALSKGGEYRPFLENLESALHEILDLREARKIDQKKGFQLPNIYKQGWAPEAESFYFPVASTNSIRRAMEEVHFVRLEEPLMSNEPEGYSSYVDRVIAASTEKDLKELEKLSFTVGFKGMEIVTSLQKGDDHYSLKDRIMIQMLSLQSELYKFVAESSALEKSGSVAVDDRLEIIKDVIVKYQNSLEKIASRLADPVLDANILRSRIISTLKIMRYSNIQNPQDVERLETLKEPTRFALEKLANKNAISSDHFDSSDAYLIDLCAMLGQGAEEHILKSGLNTKPKLKTAHVRETDVTLRDRPMRRESMQNRSEIRKENFSPRYEYEEVKKGVYALANEDTLWQILPPVTYLPSEVHNIAREIPIDTNFTINNYQWNEVLSELINLRNRRANDDGVKLLNSFESIEFKSEKTFTSKDRAIFAYYKSLQTLSSNSFAEAKHYNFTGIFEDLKTAMGEFRSDEQNPINEAIKLLSTMAHSCHQYNAYRGLDHSSGFQLPNIYRLDESDIEFEENEINDLLNKAIQEVRIVRLEREHNLRDRDNDIMETYMGRLSVSNFDSRAKDLAVIFQSIERREKKINQALESGSTEITLVDKFDNEVFKLQAYFYELEQQKNFKTVEAEQYRPELINNIKQTQYSISDLAREIKNYEMLLMASRTQLVTDLKLSRFINLEKSSAERMKLQSDSFIANSRLQFHRGETGGGILNNYIIDLYKLVQDHQTPGKES